VARFFNWGARAGEAAVSLASPSARISETLQATRALPKLLAALSSRPSPVLLDLGPVVGTNVSFFGQRLSCKMIIEDLREDVEAAAARGSDDGLADALLARLSTAVSEPLDGVLCWDVFDCLDRATARALAASLSRLLRPKGLLHGLFGTTPGELNARTKFLVQSDTSVKCRREPAPRVRRYALQTGEITRLFAGLSTIESVLLQNRTREVLLRKN
jgi:hypothetical protein